MLSTQTTAKEMNAYWETCSSNEFAQGSTFVRTKVEVGNKNSSYEALPSDAERVAGVLAEFEFFNLMD